ncbi:pyridoxal 5'-phosphate synthase [Spizellomyces sp. 'palustris']|nr:pyridoxal 5'-phosphate synthase [Spizellomyces sp. 'palustris']
MSTSLPIHHPEIAAMRINYTQPTLTESQLDPNPITQFEQWFNEVKSSGTIREPNAMALATSCPTTGRPSCRMVLFKDVDETGLVFYTNYESRKARELDANPFAACTFWWGERSVRVEGKVERTSAEESDTYYNSRPRGSRLGAWASPQSKVLTGGRAELEQHEKDIQERFKDVEDVPRPEHWGGYRVIPDKIEFWAGRPCRLHDRIVYTRHASDSEWSVLRLAP